MAGLFDDGFDKSSHGILVKHIQSLGLDIFVSQFFECVLMVIGDKDRSASLRKCRCYSTAYGTCSVHHGCFIVEDLLHLDSSFRSRPATPPSQAFVAQCTYPLCSWRGTTKRKCLIGPPYLQM